MSKKIAGIHLLIDVPTPFPTVNLVTWVEQANEMVSDIRRHISSDANIQITPEWRCVDCGRTWEENPTTGQPECCEAAQADWAANLVCLVCGVPFQPYGMISAEYKGKCLQCAT